MQMRRASARGAAGPCRDGGGGPRLSAAIRGLVDAPGEFAAAGMGAGVVAEKEKGGKQKEEAAKLYLRARVRAVHNVVGGYARWAAQVDPTFPSY